MSHDAFPEQRPNEDGSLLAPTTISVERQIV